MASPYRRDKIENWISDFMQSDRMTAFSSLLRQYAMDVLRCLLLCACETRDIDPDAIEEGDLRKAVLEDVSRLEMPRSVKPDIPVLCGAFLEHLEMQGRLGGGCDLGRYVRALQGAFLEKSGARSMTRPGSKLGRNDPCPCGSGRKYKKCCMQLLEDT